MKEEKKKLGVKNKEKKRLNIEDFKKQLKECQKLKNEYLASWQRTRADFLNYKKEEIERVSEMLKYTNIDLILKILSILDNFEIVEKKIPANLKNDENVKGLLQIKAQIKDFLKSQGVEEIKTIGQKFDPNFQEIVEEVEIKDKDSGIVIEEVQKGYLLHGKVLRPAKVKIVK
ncbi:nucleotide exchange factor GrpE [Patescibacteria group bacterium]|nr:nucleotide exchange factor GrpE [Patescibacteria group bacterium]